ncbi:MAG: hypothetical protein K8R58_03285 [Bacteroidales bacterium]|nr:hypothetical protein [Bacteroidales bacterium]
MATKLFKKIFVGIVILFTFLLVTGLLLGFLYEDRIKDIFIKKINENLNIEITVNDIEFSLLKKFPFASIKFTDVKTKELIYDKKTCKLLKAGSIFFYFNIIDIYNKNYKIKNIEIKDAFINLIVLKDGKNNYQFWKTSADSADSSFSFNLEKLIFKNVHISYINYLSNEEYLIIAKKTILKGKFSDENFFLDIKGKVFSNYIKSENVIFLENKDTHIDLVLNVDKNKKLYQILKGRLNFNKLTFNITGNITDGAGSKYLDIQIKAKKTELSSFIQELPDIYKDELKNYSNKGKLYFKTSIKGRISGSNIPLITVNFNFENGEISKKKSGFTLKNVSVKGIFSNGKNKKSNSYSLNIEDFYSELNSGHIKGHIFINNFDNPDVELVISANLNFADLQQFINIDTLETISGDIDLELSFKNRLNSLKKFTSQDFISSKTSGKMSIKNMKFLLKNSELNYNNFNGSFIFSNNDLIIQDFTGKISQSDFNMKGYFRNVLPYLFLSDQKLQINANLISQNIDFNELLKYKSSNTDTIYQFSLSDKLDFNLIIDIKKLKFRRFNASDIKGKLDFKNKNLYFKQLSFASMDGNITASGNIKETRKNKLSLNCDASIYNVNINKLFYEFENFGQQNITDRHLKGTVTANVHYSSTLSSDLSVDLNSIYSKGDLIIENGELINFMPLNVLSRYIKVEDLKHIKFSTLTNQIEIKNKQIHIPEMDIKSSTIDLQATGIHTFDNKIDYNFRILLSEILYRKTKSSQKENEEFGVIEDDGLGRTTLYLHLTGTTDNPVLKYDTKGVREKIKSDFRKEKQNLKNILKEEFDWLQKDTSIINYEDKQKEIMEKQEKGKFIIEWEETEKDTLLKNDTNIKREETKEQESTKFIIEWDEDEDDEDRQDVPTKLY